MTIFHAFQWLETPNVITVSNFVIHIVLQGKKLVMTLVWTRIDWHNTAEARIWEFWMSWLQNVSLGDNNTQDTLANGEFNQAVYHQKIVQYKRKTNNKYMECLPQTTNLNKTCKSLRYRYQSAKQNHTKQYE